MLKPPKAWRVKYRSARRRSKEEMGLYCELRYGFIFIYRTTFSNGLCEHEFDHVFFGTTGSYIKRISGPLPDHLDQLVRVNPVLLKHGEKNDGSGAIGQRVLAAWQVQAERFTDGLPAGNNASINATMAAAFYRLAGTEQKVLDQAGLQIRLPVRSCEPISKYPG